MKKTSKTVIFFGNERLATGVTTSTPTLKALVKSGYIIAAIVTNHSPASSRSVRQLEVETFAIENNIPLLLPTKPQDIIDKLKNYDATIGVLVAYGKIVPQSIIDIFPNGIVNVHPSLLPLHRGPTPIESVLLDGSTSTGVSLMKLVKAMDAGPVYSQTTVTIGKNETKQMLANKLGVIGSEMVTDALPKILTDTIKTIPQIDSNATYDSLITKSDGIIKWSKPAHEIAHEIRAYFGWPGSRTTFSGKDVLITDAHVVPATGLPGSLLVTKTSLVVATGKDGLAITRVKPVGKSEMDIQSFLAGYRKLLET